MNNYQRGAAKERHLQKHLEAEGYVVTRGAGSHGEADLIALRNGEILLIQVKATKAGPYSGFGPNDRQKLLEVAQKAGGKAVLVHYAPRKGPRFIFPDEWPS